MNFYLDPEKRTTVAVMTNVQRDAFDYIYALVKNKDNDTRQGVYAGDILRSMIRKNVPNVLRAKAKCAPQDHFFEDVGMDLARARLLEKYYSHCLSILLKYSEYVYEHLNNRMIAAINMVDDKLEANDYTLVEILSSTGALD